MTPTTPTMRNPETFDWLQAGVHPAKKRSIEQVGARYGIAARKEKLSPATVHPNQKVVSKTCMTVFFAADISTTICSHGRSWCCPLPQEG